MKILIKSNCEKLKTKLNGLGFKFYNKEDHSTYILLNNDEYCLLNEKPLSKDIIYCRKNETIFMRLVNFYLWLKKNNPEKLKEL